MPEPMDRETFLAHVAARLDMPAPAATDALDELRLHLVEAEEAELAGGASRAEASRRAVERMGDADRLGRELTRAHRARRPLLQYVSGALWDVGFEAWRAYLLAIVVLVVSVGLALPVTSTLLNAFGRGYGSFLTGPWASVGIVALTWLGFAAAGWELPRRLADRTGRDLERVRMVTAVAGLASSSVALWAVISIQLDAILAVGLPVAPFVFAAVALRAPGSPRFRPGAVPAVLLGLALVPVAVVLGVLSATPVPSDWTADTSSFGLAPEAAGIDPADVAVGRWTRDGGVTEVDVSLTSPADAQVASVIVEAWPAEVVDAVMQFGPVPIATVTRAAGTEAPLELVVPALRHPVETVTIVVGVLPDGRRVVLDTDLSLEETPPWHGTLWEWWADGS